MKSKGFRCDSVLIARILRYGVLGGTFLIALGTILAPIKIGTYQGYPSSLSQVTRFDFGGMTSNLELAAQQALHLNPLSIIQIGVVVLILIPFLRVAASIAIFATSGNRTFAVLSVFVLAILVFSALVVAPFEAWG